jgi:O-antigen/teichoic acid export membrane protein
VTDGHLEGDHASATARAAPDLLDTPSAGPAAIRGGVARVVAYGAGTLASLGSAALLFHHLGPDRAGRYVAVISLVAIVASFTDAGLTALGVREVSARSAGSQHDFLGHLVGIRTALTLAGVAVAVVFALAAGWGAVGVAGTGLLGVALLANNLQATASIPLQAQLRFGFISLMQFLGQAVAAVAVLALVLGGASLLPFFAATIPGAILALALTYRAVRGAVPVRARFSRAGWAPLLRETLPFAVATGVAAVYFRIGVIIVSLVNDDHQTGLFGAGFRIIDVLVVVPGLLISSAFPIFARAAADDRERLGYAYNLMLRAGLLAGTGMALLLAVGADPAVKLLGGQDFAAAGPVLRSQAVALAGSFVGGTASFVMLSLRRYRELLLASFGALVGTAALTAVLAATHGAQGAGVATAAGEWLMAALNVGLLARAVPELRQSFRFAVPIAAAAALGTLPAALGVPAVPATAAAAAIYAGAALAFRAVPAELLQELQRPLRRG